METVTGIQYKLVVYDDFDDINSFGRIITEVFIPSVNIIFNSDGYTFRHYKGRQKDWELDMRTIQIDSKLVEKLTEFVAIKAKYDEKLQDVTNITRNFFN